MSVSEVESLKNEVESLRRELATYASVGAVPDANALQKFDRLEQIIKQWTFKPPQIATASQMSQSTASIPMVRGRSSGGRSSGSSPPSSTGTQAVSPPKHESSASPLVRTKKMHSNSGSNSSKSGFRPKGIAPGKSRGRLTGSSGSRGPKSHSASQTLATSNGPVNGQSSKDEKKLFKPKGIAPGKSRGVLTRPVKLTTSFGGNFEDEDDMEDAEIPERFQLDFDTLDFGEDIGQGAFSTVYEGVYNGREVAIKKLQFEALDLEDFLLMFNKEVALLATLDHENVVEFIGVCTFPSYYMITGYMLHGALDEMLEDIDFEITWDQRLRMLTQVASGMNYLHTKNPRVIHRDLKSANVLVDEDFNCRITDFGLSCVKKQRLDPDTLRASYGIQLHQEHQISGVNTTYVAPLEEPVGTFPFIAPEMLEGRPYNEMVDVWAFAVMLFEMLTRLTPWHALSQGTFERMELSETYRPEMPEWTPFLFGRLAEQCWEYEPYKRPTFAKILEKLRVIGEEDEEPTEI